MKERNEKWWQVTVNVRATYEVEAKDEAEAKRRAIAAVQSDESPDGVEYAGDGVDNCVQVSGDIDD